jgi:glycosyltransferase involved in cell wall biosynthesis
LCAGDFLATSLKVISIMYPKISIVTPSYNQAQFLEQTIVSVISQKYPNLEYLVIDGGSNDESQRIIEQYQEHLAYWVSEKDNGQAHAINKGFARSTGEIMGWLNSDDILMPGSLATIGEVFSLFDDLRWITGYLTVINETGQIIKVRPPFGRLRTLVAWGWYHGQALGFINQESTFWRRSLWDEAGQKVDEERHSSFDYELWKQFARYEKLYALDSQIGAFRYQAQQKTAQIASYYEEIGVTFNPRQRRKGQFYFMLEILSRLISSGLAYRIYYNSATKKWVKNRPGIRHLDHLLFNISGLNQEHATDR